MLGGDSVQETKTCTACDTAKPAGEFYKNRSHKNRSQCKGCCAAQTAEYRKRVSAERRELHREYRRQNRERISERKRERYAESGRSLQKEYRERNAERIRARQREYRERNKEKIQERRRREWQEKRDAVSQRNRDYKRRDPVANRTREHRRRARKHANGGDFTPAEWAALCNHFGNVCLSCGSGDITIDHVLPLSKGGRNDIANLQPLCKGCNVSKGQRHVDYRDAERLAAFLSTLAPRASHVGRAARGGRPCAQDEAATAALVPASRTLARRTRL